MAAYADLLRGGTHVGDWTWHDVARAARGASGDDRNGLRHEFAELVDQARQVVAQPLPAAAIASGE